MKKKTIIAITYIFLIALIGCKKNTNVARDNLATVSIINEKENSYNNKKNIKNDKEATKSNITIKIPFANKNIDFIEKVFNSNDRILINDMIIDMQNRDYNKVYKDLNSGKYKIVVDNFIENYGEVFNDFKIEFSKKEYKEFNKSLIKKLEEHKYNKIKKEINEIVKKYDKKAKTLISEIKNYKIKEIIKDINNGEYKDFISEIVNVILRDEYKELKDEFINEFVEGEYSEIFYDFVYKIFEITYKYSKNKLVNEEAIEDNKEVEIVEVKEENEEKNYLNLDFIIRMAQELIRTIIIVVIVIVILKIKNKNDD